MVGGQSGWRWRQGDKLAWEESRRPYAGAQAQDGSKPPPARVHARAYDRALDAPCSHHPEEAMTKTGARVRTRAAATSARILGGGGETSPQAASSRTLVCGPLVKVAQPINQLPDTVSG